MEKKWHRLVCNLFFELLQVAFGNEALLAINQFLYWDASDDKTKRCSPDVYATPGKRDRALSSWKVWELGAPSFVLEVLSKSSWPGDVADKPGLYEKIGVAEYVVFDPEWDTRSRTAGHEPRLLRAWRRISGALAEVELGDSDRYFCEKLGFWVRACPSEDPAAEGRPCLRLGQGEHGDELVPTNKERANDEAQRANDQTRRANDEAQRAEAAEAAMADAEAQAERAKADAILGILDERGIEVPAAIEAQIRECRDSDKLDRWIRRAVTRAFVAEVVADSPTDSPTDSPIDNKGTG